MKKKAKKKLLKKQKKHAAGWGAASGAIASMASDVAIGVLSNFVEDNVTPHLKKGSKKKGKEGDPDAGRASGAQNGQAPRRGEGVKDVAAAIVTALCDRGPQSIPDLLGQTRAKLVQVLRALRDLREFRLVEFAADDDRVQLTATGSHTATVLSKERIREDAAALLEK